MVYIRPVLPGSMYTGLELTRDHHMSEHTLFLVSMPYPASPWRVLRSGADAARLAHPGTTTLPAPRPFWKQQHGDYTSFPPSARPSYLRHAVQNILGSGVRGSEYTTRGVDTIYTPRRHSSLLTSRVSGRGGGTSGNPRRRGTCRESGW